MNYNLALFALMFLLINGGVIDTTEALIFLALTQAAIIVLTRAIPARHDFIGF